MVRVEGVRAAVDGPCLRLYYRWGWRRRAYHRHRRIQGHCMEGGFTWRLSLMRGAASAQFICHSRAVGSPQGDVWPQSTERVAPQHPAVRRRLDVAAARRLPISCMEVHAKDGHRESGLAPCIGVPSCGCGILSGTAFLGAYPSPQGIFPCGAAGSPSRPNLDRRRSIVRKSGLR
jgi:hypothetical protein